MPEPTPPTPLTQQAPQHRHPRHRTRANPHPLPVDSVRRAAVLHANIGHLLDAVQTLRRDCHDLRDATTALDVSLRAHAPQLTRSELGTNRMLWGLQIATATFHRELDQWHRTLTRQAESLRIQAGGRPPTLGDDALISLAQGMPGAAG